MKRLLYAAFCTFATALLSAREPLRLDWNTVPQVVKALSLEEKVLLLVGAEAGLPDGFEEVGRQGVPGACGATHAIDRLGIPSIIMADGPAGVRIDPTRGDTDRTYYGTAFPIASALASTWNTDLVHAVGRAMGEEAREYGIDLLMAPALNIQRNPLCGRNFEYYSEDPLLSGKLAAAAVQGIQQEGVGATVKHFAVNNQETNRVANQANLTRRALYEMYLRGFEIVVREAHPWAVMTSYNYVNGTYASESSDLLEALLRGTWGFRGVVMSDWFGGNDAPAQMRAGNDLLMPGRMPQYEAILKAVRSGKLPTSILDRNVEHLLRTVLKTQSYHHYDFHDTPDLAKHADVARKAALESVVLVKNEQALPLKAKARVALLGNTSYDSISGGTGSGDVNEAYTLSIREGIEHFGLRTAESLADAYRQYLKQRQENRVEDREGNPLYDFLAHPRDPEMPVDEARLKELVRKTDAAVITIGRNAGEHADRVVQDDFTLTREESELIRRCSELFRKAGKPVIVVLNIGGVIETASWSPWADAIVIAWHGGQEAGDAVGAVLSGAENPSGHLPMSFPLTYEDLPGADHFPSDHGADVDEILRNVLDIRGKRYERENVDFTDYVEDIYVGYRYFTTWNKATAFPFGHGLSYTEFRYGPLCAERADDGARVISFVVTNTGKRAGKDVIQLYLKRPGEDRPVRELAAFCKTRLLKPGESQHIAFRLNERDLACYDESTNALVLPEGTYHFTVASHSEAEGPETAIVIHEQKTLERLPDILRPQKTFQIYQP